MYRVVPVLYSEKASSFVGNPQLVVTLLRRYGYEPLILIEQSYLDTVSGWKEVIVTCENIYKSDSVLTALYPFRGNLSGFVDIPDPIWPSIFTVSNTLNIPFPDEKGQVNARVKPIMRRLTTVLSPVKYKVIGREDVTEPFAQNLIDELGLPIVLKPIWGYGCRHIEIIHDEVHFKNRLQIIFGSLATDCKMVSYFDGENDWNPREQILAEEYLDGKEFSLEGYLKHGTLKVLMIQEKYRTHSYNGISIETANLAPTPTLKPIDQIKIHSQASELLSAIGLSHGFVHLEFKWTDNRLKIIEVNPRIGGGSVTKTLSFWYCENLVDWPIRLLLNESLPVIIKRKSGFLLGVFFSASNGGYYHGLDGVDKIRDLDGFVFDTVYCELNQKIPDPQFSRSNRDGWMYVYDVFFYCPDVYFANQIYELVRKILTVKVSSHLSSVLEQNSE